jgi:hypothetical protein
LSYCQIPALYIELPPPGMLSSHKIAVPLLSMFSDRFEEEDGEMCSFFQVELF